MHETSRTPPYAGTHGSLARSPRAAAVSERKTALAVKGAANLGYMAPNIQAERPESCPIYHGILREAICPDLQTNLPGTSDPKGPRSFHHGEEQTKFSLWLSGVR